MRRPLVKAFNPPEPPPTLDVLLDRLQKAAIDLGEAKSRGSDYARAVASQQVKEARQAVDAAVIAQSAAPMLREVAEPERFDTRE